MALQLPEAALLEPTIAPLPPPPPAALVRASTVPAALSLGAKVSDGCMSLCYVGDPRQPFADVRNAPVPGGICRARTVQEFNSAMSKRRASELVPVATPIVQGVLVNEEAACLRRRASCSSIISYGSPVISTDISPFGVPSAPTPINVEHWQTVGERLANIFGNTDSLLSSPAASYPPTPISATSYGTASFGTRTFTRSPVASPTGAAVAVFGLERTLSGQNAGAGVAVSPFGIPAATRW